MKEVWERWTTTIKEIIMLVALQLAVGYIVLEVMSR